MVKAFGFFAFLFFGTVCGYSQNISPSIIAPAGASDKTGQIQLDWTLGEIAVETSATSDGLLTQGFHQPLLILPANFISVLPRPIVTGFTIRVNPNPVQAVLNINLQSLNESKVDIRLSDINGKTMYRTSAYSNGSSVKINMQHLSSGIYLLYIINSTGSVINTYRIVKAS